MDLGSGNARDFNVFFSARNGFYTQLLRFRRVNGKWLSATSVTFMAPAFQTNPALHKVDHGYPLDAHGKPDGI
jgi:hypothetical protein